MNVTELIHCKHQACIDMIAASSLNDTVSVLIQCMINTETSFWSLQSQKASNSS